MSSKQKFLLFLIVILAVFFRFYLIRQTPGGLFPDMAANGLDINLMQAGHLQPFYDRGNGREALFFYMEWASSAVFGRGAWQFSIVSAFMGVMAVIMCYFVTYRLMLVGADTGNEKYQEERKRAINIALLAAFLMAVSSWHVVLSRTAFRATLIPFFSALTFYFLLASYQALTNKSRVWFSFLCGASFALGFYTYIAFRIMAPILFMALAWPFLATLTTGQFKKTIREYFFPAIMFVMAFIIFIFPIAKYFSGHPGSFLGRAGQVSVYNPNLYTVDGAQLSGPLSTKTVLAVVAEVFKTQFLGFFKDGDLNWRQNISGYPFLSPLVSPFFGAGLAVMLVLAIYYFFKPNKRSGWWKYYLIIGWFFGMLLPVVTTAEGIPHGLRGIGVIPVVFIISAWAIYYFAEFAYEAHKKFWHRCEKCHEEHYESSSRFIKKALATLGIKLVAVCFFTALVLQTYFLYFIYAYNSPENFYYFRSDLTPVSQYLVSRCNKNSTYLVLDKFSVQTTDYLTSDWKGNFNSPCNNPYKQVDPEDSWKLSGLKPGDEIIFTQSSIFDVKKFKKYHPDTLLKQEVRNKFGQAVMAVYEVK